MFITSTPKLTTKWSSTTQVFWYRELSTMDFSAIQMYFKAEKSIVKVSPKCLQLNCHEVNSFVNVHNTREHSVCLSLSPSLSSLASHTRAQTHFKFWYFDALRIIRSSVEGHILYLKSRSKRWLAQATSGRSERFPRVLRIISGSVTSWLDYLYTIWPFVTKKICPVAYKICQSRLKIVINTQKVTKDM